MVDEVDYFRSYARSDLANFFKHLIRHFLLKGKPFGQRTHPRCPWLHGILKLSDHSDKTSFCFDIALRDVAVLNRYMSVFRLFRTKDVGGSADGFTESIPPELVY